ncbi:MAG: hypothetical protein IOMNBAOH_00969 [Rhodocyclaceae bacterium]|nr:arsenate reductase (glutaredoxin) [Rhodocyclaceae bacterium]MCG3186412.1 hypothetical protein [Rhodocyclaceae bacterium]
MNAVTIYHNPDCGTSRNVLGLIRANGIEPTVIEYLKAPPDRDTLRALIARMGMRVRDVLRVKGTPYQELDLGAAHWSDDALLEQMHAHPILINRPIVASDRGVRLCRPSDMVIELLPRRPGGDHRKADGTPFLVDTPIAGTDPELAAALRDTGLVDADLAEPGLRFFAYDTLSGARVGYGGFQCLGEDVLLRSLVALPPFRGQRLGEGMLALLQRRAFDEGARTAWLLTTTAAPFFERAGFKPVERSAAPAAILATQQAATRCPADAALLTRRISL